MPRLRDIGNPNPRPSYSGTTPDFDVVPMENDYREFNVDFSYHNQGKIYTNRGGKDTVCEAINEERILFLFGTTSELKILVQNPSS